MSRVAIIFIDSLINAFVHLYCPSKILNHKIDYRKPKYWIILLICSLYVTGGYLLTDSFVRILIYCVLLSLIICYYFHVTVVQSFVVSFSTLIVGLLSEILYMIIISIFGVQSVDQIRNLFFGELISNIIIAILWSLLINIPWLRRKLSTIVSNIKFRGNFTIFVYSILSFLVLSVLLYFVYFELDLVSAGILCLILVITFASLTLYLFKEKNDNYKLQVEYEILEQNLEEYERMYQTQRMMNHEYKNELSTVRGLVGKKNVKLQNYLDELIDVRMEKQTKWMETLKRIPEPTLRGLLYYKFSTMEHQKIKIDFEISKNVTVKKFQLISQELYKKICRLLGIYLDNAIQAVESLKEKSIRVELYLDSNSSDILIMSIFNSFEGKVDIDRMNEKGYSTKGKGRGLGLAMANEIIKEEKLLSSETQVFKNSFGQKLKIQLKK